MMAAAVVYAATGCGRNSAFTGDAGSAETHITDSHMASDAAADSTVGDTSAIPLADADGADADAAESDGSLPRSTDGAAVDSSSGDAVFPDTSSKVSLIKHGLFALASSDKDPFWKNAPEQAVPCTNADTSVDIIDAEPWYEIETDKCNYATATQPSLHAISAGDTLTARVWRYKLSTGAGPFHMTLAMGPQAAEIIAQKTHKQSGGSGLW
ncbi:MAG: hypothetical protein KC502_07595, partial [Myxococcales bacterium]|nr:hypothetical protein [Myxococcales bacterium]